VLIVTTPQLIVFLIKELIKTDLAMGLMMLALLRTTKAMQHLFIGGNHCITYV